MEHAQSLIRTVVRAFYSTRHILVIDALMLHSILWVDDLAHVLSMNTKELRKLCTILREDKLVSVSSRSEIKDNGPRAMNKEYYYINYHLAIDAIKLRIVRLEQKIRDLYKPTQERKDWQCPRCNAQWTEMEVLHKFDEKIGGFACVRCGHALERNEVSATDRAGSERSSRLMSQLERLVGPQGILRHIDQADIPTNEFDQALARQKPIQRSDSAPGPKWTPVQKEQTSGAVHGSKLEAPDIKVAFTTQQETEDAEAEKKRQRLEQQEKNALPEWYTSSTVSGQKTGLGDQEEARMKSVKDAVGFKAIDEDTETKPETDNNEFIAQYYRELKEADAAEKARLEAEEEEDDDDEDEFEDIQTTDTPASTASVGGLGSKRKADDSDLGSGLNTAVSTPAVAESPSKRFKVEAEAPEDEDDDDEDEFEDIMGPESHE